MKSSIIAFAGIFTRSMLATCGGSGNVLKRDEQRKIIVDTLPSPEYLSPEESMKKIYLQPGYRLELVASEPMIHEPVAITWDANGRMFVAEMNTYMQDVNGTGELAPVCSIKRLEDTDGDGVAEPRVKRVREQTTERTTPWTKEELDN